MVDYLIWMDISRIIWPLLTPTNLEMIPMKLLFLLLGLVLIVEGLPYFAFPDKMKQWTKKIQEIPDPHLRAMGFLSICVGLGVAYLFK